MNRNNVNANGIAGSKEPISMNNANDRDRRIRKSRQVEIIADRLVETFKNEGYRQYYCKVAWTLSEARIWDNVEQAMKGNTPAKLFSYLCRKDGV